MNYIHSLTNKTNFTYYKALFYIIFIILIFIFMLSTNIAECVPSIMKMASHNVRINSEYGFVPLSEREAGQMANYCMENALLGCTAEQMVYDLLENDFIITVEDIYTILIVMVTSVPETVLNQNGFSKGNLISYLASHITPSEAHFIRSKFLKYKNSIAPEAPPAQAPTFTPPPAQAPTFTPPSVQPIPGELDEDNLSSSSSSSSRHSSYDSNSSSDSSSNSGSDSGSGDPSTFDINLDPNLLGVALLVGVGIIVAGVGLYLLSPRAKQIPSVDSPNVVDPLPLSPTAPLENEIKALTETPTITDHVSDNIIDLLQNTVYYTFAWSLLFSIFVNSSLVLYCIAKTRKNKHDI